MDILDIVNLQPVVIREGGLDAVADWKDVWFYYAYFIIQQKKRMIK
jgi:hypothetical protein